MYIGPPYRTIVLSARLGSSSVYGVENMLHLLNTSSSAHGLVELYDHNAAFSCGLQARPGERMGWIGSVSPSDYWKASLAVFHLVDWVHISLLNRSCVGAKKGTSTQRDSCCYQDRWSDSEAIRETIDTVEVLRIWPQVLSMIRVLYSITRQLPRTGRDCLLPSLA